jgi:hypothetical protein
MSFTINDFKNPQIQTKISAIILDKMNIELTACYHDLTERQKKKFQQLQNEYLNSAPFKTDEWEETLTADFNDVTYDFLHSKKNYHHMVDNSILDKQMCFRNRSEEQYFEKTEAEAIARFNEIQMKKMKQQSDVVV